MKKKTEKLISLLSAGLITAAGIGIFPSAADSEPVNQVMYGTPEIDGVLDDEYRLSSVVHTVDYAKSGKLSLGMPNLSFKKKMAFVRSGIFENTTGNKLLASGDYSIAEFPKADVYFLWDSEALYVFAQVFDSDIQALSENTVAGIYGDIPWLTDSMTHIIFPAENPYAPIYAYVLAGGNACWDHVGAGNDYYAKGGWTLLGDFTSQTAAQRKKDAENAGSVINEAEGYYTLELRIPLSDAEFDGAPIRESFLKNGNTFRYSFYITDGENGMQSNGYHGNNQVIYISDTSAGTVLKFIGGPGEETTLPITDHSTDTAQTDSDIPTDSCTKEPVTDPVTVPNSDIVSEETPKPPHTEAPTGTDTGTDTDTQTGSYTDTEPQTDSDSVNTEPQTEPDFDPIIYGDITGDGRVNAADLVRLMKYISGADVEIESVTADVNGDGAINSKDLTRLMKLISNGFSD